MVRDSTQKNLNFWTSAYELLIFLSLTLELFRIHLQTPFLPKYLSFLPDMPLIGSNLSIPHITSHHITSHHITSHRIISHHITNTHTYTHTHIKHLGIYKVRGQSWLYKGWEICMGISWVLLLLVSKRNTEFWKERYLAMLRGRKHICDLYKIGSH